MKKCLGSWALKTCQSPKNNLRAYKSQYTYNSHNFIVMNLYFELWNCQIRLTILFYCLLFYCYLPLVCYCYNLDNCRFIFDLIINESKKNWDTEKKISITKVWLALTNSAQPGFQVWHASFVAPVDYKRVEWT